MLGWLGSRVGGLHEIRQQGWNNPQGDKYFRQQRKQADKADTRTARIFYTMMQKIGQEIHLATNAFLIQKDGSSQPKVLDMCMAPGGYLETVLKMNPKARAVGFSLPVESGGHRVLLPPQKRVELRLLDITMLAEDMGVTDVPVEHPEHAKFLLRQLNPEDLFDLVLCDGQVLRTHSREDYREKREARRLTLTQLALGLQHTRPGGTMVVLLHKLEAWDTVLLLYTFRAFSTVTLFKPTTSHAKRSSFYMVARNIQSQQAEATRAVERWKTIWKAATLKNDEEYWTALRQGEPSVEKVLGEFGPELVEMGKVIWDTQAKALAEAPFIKGKS
ncbi:hypothetical protein LZ30DRAFT_775460 [Colletotrichum cereale]|nr:hypothetical protein LZ30DRAFT_775460 [Colletotrichum cereale]